jgi:hypothetical protein
MTVKMPIDPRTMPDGVVLVLNVRYAPQDGQRANPTIYSHAAIKMSGRWYLTGSRAPQDAGWGAVEAWLGRDNRELVRVEIATGARTIWPEPATVAVRNNPTVPHPMDSFPIVIPQKDVDPENCPHHPDDPGPGECPFNSCRNCGGYHCGWSCPDGYGD